MFQKIFMQVSDQSAFIFLLLAVFFEVTGTSFMKASDGFKHLVPSLLVVFSYIFCFSFLTLALKKIPLGIAYAIWGGLGTIVIFLVGVLIYQEPFSIIKLFCLGLIIAGMIGLKSF